MVMKSSKERRRKVLSARKQAEEHKSGFDNTALAIPEGTSFFSVKKEGAIRLDIIPFVFQEGNPYAKGDAGEDLHWERTYWVHRGVGADENSYCCLKKTFGKACPICDHRAKLVKDPDADEDLVKDLAPKERQIWAVVDQSIEGKKKGIQIWDVSYHLFGKFLNEKIKMADDDDKYEYFADPEEGSTLKIGASEKSFGGRTFFEFSNIEFKPRKEPLDAKLLDACPCLDELPKEVGYRELKDIFLQTSANGKDEDDEDEDEDDKPAPKKGGKKPPVDEDDEDEDEEPAPKKKPTKKPVPKDEDEDEDDEDEPEDEDEDDEPAPKKAAPKKKGGKDADPTAQDLGITKGAMVEYEGMSCTVTKVSPDGTSLTLIDEDDEEHKAVAPSEVELIDTPDEDEDEDDKPAPKKGKKPAPVDEDEDEEDDEPEDEDEDEEPAPKKKPTKKK